MAGREVMQMPEKCIGMGCERQARFEIVDALKPVIDRKQVPACARHALLWLRQGRRSIWVFPLGEGDTESLTEEQITQEIERSGEPPLPR